MFKLCAKILVHSIMTFDTVFHYYHKASSILVKPHYIIFHITFIRLHKFYMLLKHKEVGTIDVTFPFFILKNGRQVGYDPQKTLRGRRKSCIFLNFGK